MKIKGILKYIGIGLGVVIIIFLIVFLVKFFKKSQPEQITLKFWGVFDDSDVYQELIEKFSQKNKNIKIEYKKFAYKDYEPELLDSFKKNKGPDIFYIHNSFLPRYKSYLYPIPKKILSLKEIYKNYPKVVFKDFYDGKDLYALPLYISTLALFYNKDLFKKHQITFPPRTWSEFLTYTEALTEIDENGNILTSGASMGTYDNINRAVDILYLLMMQSGVRFYDEKGKAAFAQPIEVGGKIINPALNALTFYTNFSNPKKRVYSYNNTLDYSIDLFAKGKLAMMLNYNWHIKTIKKKNSLLNFDIAPVPQIKGSKKELSFANYWALAVNKNSPYKDIAWEFIKFLQEPENLKIYLLNSFNPTSRKDLIKWQIETMPELAIFAQQIEIADSFLRYDDLAYEKIFSRMINEVIEEFKSPQTALEDAELRINDIIRNFYEK